MDARSSIESQLDTWIKDHAEDIIAQTQGILRIPSVAGPAEPGAPFGRETVNALEFALDVARGYGLTTKNLDGYAGHAEFKSSAASDTAPIVGILAHVDVVPEGDDWQHPPFGAEIEDGVIYARGAIDDKGPAMSVLFALAAIAALNPPLTHRIRVILGCDEESGFGCVDHYFKHEEMPVTGFTPDGSFPLIYAEKGIASYTVKASVPVVSGDLYLTRLSGGLRSNMVPDKASATLKGSKAALETAAALLTTRTDVEVGIPTEEGLTIVARGVSAHGSTPAQGTNAVVLLCQALAAVDLPHPQAKLLDQIASWGGDTDGRTLGIDGEDDIAGPLTSNLGVAVYEDGTCSLTLNVRYPVSWTLDYVTNRLLATLEPTSFALTNTAEHPSLYVPLDDPLVATLLEVYRDETGDMSEPQTIGGGTYARAMIKGVAFGPTLDGREGGAHQHDEHWYVDDLLRASRIYAKAIYRLASQV